MATFSYGSLPEPHLDPPCTVTADHEELLNKIDDVNHEIWKAENTMDAWADFSAELAKLDAPETILALVERLRPSLENWMNSHLGALRTQVVELEDQERDLLF
jgi:hypothetical protein